MDWKQYEVEIYEHFEEQFPEAEVSLDAKITGLYSKVERQVDILIEQYVAGNRMVIAVDGKYFNKKVDVKCVESFIGMLEDIGAHKGLLISKEGFTEAAYNRAHFGSSEIELDILNFADLHHFQSHGAIPYAGNNGVLLPSPFGWVVDGQTTSAWLATIYQQGLDLKQAMDSTEFMYVNFWNGNENGDTLSDLLSFQEDNLKEIDESCEIQYLPTIKRKDEQVKLRVATLKNYPSKEYTGFVEFDDFIFYCVMFSPCNRAKRNLRKLENILRSVRPIKIEHPESVS